MRLPYRRNRLLILLTALVLTSADCSLMLDTESLRKGSGPVTVHEAGGAGAMPDGAVESGVAEDGPSEAAQCNVTMHEACTDCAAVNCCAETMACTSDSRCNLAFVQLAQCRRDARRATNPSVAIAACNATFVQTGGGLASSLMTCMSTHCQAVCTS